MHSACLTALCLVLGLTAARAQPAAAAGADPFAATDRIFQDYLLKPVWMALVWLTHVAVVALEWCFSIDLLGAGTLGPVTHGLQAMRDALTTPWLAPVLAIAAVALLYNGLVRRRVVDTLGQFALLLAMMIGGLWVIADPAGTVGVASAARTSSSVTW